jgi:hypothetical protein
MSTPTRAKLWGRIKELYSELNITKANKKIHWPYFNTDRAKSEIRKLSGKKIKSVVNKKLVTDFFVPDNKLKSISVKANDLVSKLNNIVIPEDKRLQFQYKVNKETRYKIIKNIREIKTSLDMLNKNKTYVAPAEYSDADAIVEAIKTGSKVTLSWINKPKDSYNTNNGGYFQYFHKLDKLDLSRYQIYTKDQKSDQTHCLIYAFQQSGLFNENDINSIKLSIIEDTLNVKHIRRIAEHLDIQIELKILKEHKTHHINDRATGPIIKIGLIANHYFLNESTDIGKTAITDYDEVKEHRLFPSIQKKTIHDKVRYNSIKKGLSSYEVISYLYAEKKALEPITLENVQTLSTEKLIEYTTLRAPLKKCRCPLDQDKNVNCPLNDLTGRIKSDCMNNEFKPTLFYENDKIFHGVFKIDDPNDNYQIIFLDFETFQDSELGYHIPFCANISVYSKYFEFQYNDNFYGLDCVKSMLDSIKTHSVIIAHNAGFEFKCMIDHFYSIKDFIQTGSMLKQCTAKYRYNHLLIKDSYAMISSKLENFPKMLKLNVEDKGKYPYRLITKDNFNSMVPIEEALDFIEGDQSDKNTFIKEAINAKALDNGILDIKKITIDYCHNDVEILAQGYMTFRNQILEVTQLDILYLVSSAQLADKYLTSRGCYQGCYDIRGISEDFIRRCIVGGRTMCANNQKHHIKEEIADLDANSLYPSAMYEMKGFVRGLPKVLSPKQIEKFEYIKNKLDEYYVKIMVTGIKTHRAFPLLSVVDEKTNVRNFTNDIIGKYFYLDRVSLEDAIQFQGIEYEVIQGYYFNQGHNTEINSVIKELFDTRKMYKDAGNSIQEVYKLIMNSAYGKTIQKPVTNDKKFVVGDSNEQHKFIWHNYNHIVEYTKINDNLFCYKIKKSILEHFSRVHIGVNVLSMSKRIMNRVMCLAEDNDIKIYYQDTDSMHMEHNKIDLLKTKFKEMYNKDLVGKYLGQFSSDFSVDAKRDETYEIRAIESIFVGKKCYIDKLQYKSPEGRLQVTYHCRMKGIPSKCIKQKWSDFTKLYNGKPRTYDLTEVIKLQNQKNYRVINVVKGSFTRTIQYENTELVNYIEEDDEDDMP